MNNESFDERQKLLRMRIYAKMFWFLIFYVAIFSIIDNCFEPLLEYRDVMFIGIMLALTISVILMIFKDCYFSRFETKGSIAFCFIVWIVIIVINILTFIDSGIIRDGRIDDVGAIGVSLMWTAIIASYIIKHFIDKKKATTSEED